MYLDIDSATDVRVPKMASLSSPPAESVKSTGGGVEVLGTEGTLHKPSPSSPLPLPPSSLSRETNGAESSSSDSDSSDEDVSEEMAELKVDDSGLRAAEAILSEAGVQLDLEKLQPGEGGAAPLELVSTFLMCVMGDEHEAAQLLCEKILQFEPDNSTAQEFLPVIQERMKLNAELPSESSSEESASSEDEDSSGSSSSSSSDDDKDTLTHCHRNCTPAT